MALRLLLLAVAFLGLAACRSGVESASGPTVGATPVDPATAGTLSAVVRFQGVVPTPREVVMRSAPVCAAAHGTPVLDPSLQVTNGRVAQAVVWIREGLEGWGFAPPADRVIVDQRGCLYEPRVSVAMVGQPVEFRNGDPEAHNVHGRSASGRVWNFMLSRQGTSRTVTFSEPEVAVSIGCDIHPWMAGFLAVLPHPFAAVTNPQGEVSISGVPPGEYTVSVWHEKLGRQDRRVTLLPRGSVEVEFLLSAAGAGRD